MVSTAHPFPLHHVPRSDLHRLTRVCVLCLDNAIFYDISNFVSGTT